MLEGADEVLYLVADELAAAWLESVNSNSRSLHEHYRAARPRGETYAAIVDEVLARLGEGGRICLAFYGHPGVYSTIAHETVQSARAEGVEVEMLPAVSAEDCLFAELGVDPGRSGWQSYDATDLQLHSRAIDPSAALVLWQSAIVGRLDYVPAGDPARLPRLAAYLGRYYPPEHEVVCYAASPYPFFKPVIEHFPLSELPNVELPRLCLLYVSPAVTRRPDLTVVDSNLATA